MVCQPPMCRQECPEFGNLPLLLITCGFHPFWFLLIITRTHEDSWHLLHLLEVQETSALGWGYKELSKVA